MGFALLRIARVTLSLGGTANAYIIAGPGFRELPLKQNIGHLNGSPVVQRWPGPLCSARVVLGGIGNRQYQNLNEGHIYIQCASLRKEHVPVKLLPGTLTKP